MSLDKDYRFRKFIETQTNKYGLVLATAVEAKKLSEDYENLILHSEAITHVVHGTKPRLKDITRWESEAFELKDLFCYIEDVDVCNAVYDSFYASRETGNLVYKYNNIKEPSTQARVRILLRLLWDKLGMYYMKGRCQTVAKKKKSVNSEVVEAAVEQEAVLAVENVEGKALPEITEDNIDDAKESIVVDATADEVAESFIEDVEAVKDQLPAADSVKSSEKDEPSKSKRTRKVVAKKPADIKGKAIELKGLVWLYSNSAILTSKRTISGTVYIWGDKVTNRYPVTDKPNGAGDLSALRGWVYATDLGLE